MSLTASPLRPLDKPLAILAALELIGASAAAARSLTGYLDYAEGEPYWRPPRTERLAPRGTFDRAFRAPADTLARGLDFLGEHRRDLPTQAFVFVISDFVVPLDLEAWERALEHMWELVPVVLQDPVWERTFPDVGGVSIAYADPAGGRAAPVYLSRREAGRVRLEHEARWDALFRDFRGLGIEPVAAGSHDRAELLADFLRWADMRVMWRGAVT